MKIRLIEEWREAYKWLSVNCMVVAAAIQGGWTAISDDLKQNVPHDLISGITIAILVLGIFGRLIDQSQNKSH